MANRKVYIVWDNDVVVDVYKSVGRSVTRCRALIQVDGAKCCNTANEMKHDLRFTWKCQTDDGSDQNICRVEAFELQ